MSTAEADGNSRTAHRTGHPDAAIVFGSAATGASGKPASVRATCEAIGLARSTYYYQSHRSASSVALEQKIVLRLHELRDTYPNDGYRRMTDHLQSEGLKVNRKRIARLMHLHGLSSKPSKPGGGSASYYRPPPIVADLREKARLSGPNQVWIADIAYVHIPASLIYAAAIVDEWSREVVGYAASTQISGRLANIALHSAVRAHRPAFGCIHHSTCGVQYLMRGYRNLLRQYGLIPSVADGMDSTMSPAPRQIIEMEGYAGWDDVAARAREFISSVYSRDRIDRVLGN